MALIGDLLVRLGVDAGALERGLSSAEKRVERFGTQLFFAGSRITAGVTVPLVAAGGAIAKFGLDFDKAMTESLAIMDDITPKIRADMEAVALSLSETTKFSAKEAAEGYYHLASAGLDAAAAMGALPIAAKFAQAGVMDLAKSTEFLAGAQAAVYGAMGSSEKKVEDMVRIADVLTLANNRALGTIQDFAEALTNKAGAAMRQFKIPLEEGVAVLAAYASQNVKGRLAGQQFMMMVRDLTTYALKNADAFKKYGIAVFNTNGSMRNMADIIRDVEIATKHMTAAQVTQMLMELKIPQRSIAATRALIGYSDAIRAHTVALREAGGTTESVANKQMEAMSNQLLMLYHRLQNIGIALFNAFVPVINQYIIPAFNALIDVAGKFKDSVLSMPVGLRAFALGGLALVAAIGPVVMLLGSFILLGSQVMRMGVGLAGMLSNLATAHGLAAGGATLEVLAEKELAAAMIVEGNAARAAAVARGVWSRSALDAAKVAGAEAVMIRNAQNAALVDATKNMSLLGKVFQTSVGFIKTYGGAIAGVLATLYIVYPLIDELIKGMGGLGGMFKWLGKETAEWTGGMKDGLIPTLQVLPGIMADLTTVAREGWRGLGQAIAWATSQVLDAQSQAGKFRSSLSGPSIVSPSAPGGASPALPILDQWMVTLRARMKDAADPGPIDDLGQRFVALVDGPGQGVLNFYDAWMAENDQVMRKGAPQYVADKISEWAENISISNREYEISEDHLILMKKLADDVNNSLKNNKRGFINAPLPAGPKQGTAEFGATFQLYLSDNKGFNLAWQRAREEAEKQAAAMGEDIAVGLDKPVKKELDDIEKKFKDLMQTGQGMDTLTAVWQRFGAELQSHPAALKVLVEEYFKLKTETGEGVTAFEELARSLGMVSKEEQDAKNKVREFGDVWGTAARNIIENFGFFMTAWENMKAAGMEEEFWKNNATGLDVLLKGYSRAPESMKPMISAYQIWKLTSKDATDAAKKDLDSTATKMEDAFNKIAADLEDKRDEIVLFNDQYGAREVAGLRKGMARTKMEHDKIIAQLQKAADESIGIEHWFYAARVKIAQESSDEILRLMEIEGSHREAQAVGVSTKLLRIWDTFSIARRRQLIDERKAWLDLMEAIQGYQDLMNSMSSLAGIVGLEDLSKGLTMAASAANTFTTGVEKIKFGDTLGTQISGAIDMVGALINVYKQLGTVVGHTNGAISGAMAGAQIGAVTGVGALFGAGIGALVGWIQGGKAEKKALEDLKAQFIDTAGGMDALRAQAEKAGFSIDAFFSQVLSKDIEEAKKQLKELSDAMELRSLKADFLEAGGGLYELAKKAARAGIDIGIALNAKTPTAFKAAVEEINKAFAAMEKRIEGLKGAAAGLADEIKGYAQQIDKLLKDSKAVIEAPEEHPGAGGVGISGPGIDTAAITKRLNMMAITANNVFLSMVHETGDVVAALDEVGPALDAILELQGRLGIAVNDANTQWLLGLRQVQQANPDLMLQISGLHAQIVGLGNAQRITQEQFDAFGTSATQIYDDLIARGVPSRDALALMQPTLQALWEAQQKFGLKTDEATQKLINMGVESGMIDTTMKPTFQTLIDILGEGTEGQPGLLRVLKDIAATLGIIYTNAVDAGGAIGNMPVPGQPGGPEQHGGGTPPGPPGPNTPRPPNYPPNLPWPPGSGGQPAGYYAEGGLVGLRPRGTDTVPAMLTPGEFVIPKEVVAALGTPFLNSLTASKPTDWAMGSWPTTIDFGGDSRPPAPVPPAPVTKPSRPSDGAGMPLDAFWAQVKTWTTEHQPPTVVPDPGPPVTINITAHDTKGVKEFAEKELRPILVDMWRGNRSRFRTETRDTLGIKE